MIQCDNGDERTHRGRVKRRGEGRGEEPTHLWWRVCDAMLRLQQISQRCARRPITARCLPPCLCASVYNKSSRCPYLPAPA